MWYRACVLAVTTMGLAETINRLLRIIVWGNRHMVVNLMGVGLLGRLLRQLVWGV